MSYLENYFQPFREGIVGIDKKIETPFGKFPIIYADWTASGRFYKPIEDFLVDEVGPYIANTHTETNTTGSTMTHAYKMARKIIKKHVHASDNDVLISTGSGMTGVINKFQRLLGLKIHEKHYQKLTFDKFERPIIFVSHMEHHSNQTSWLETIGEVVIIPADENGLFSLSNFEEILKEHESHPFKITAVTSCSNVTGIKTPYHKIAKLTHKYGGKCFVDFACSAPYIDINMHPNDPEEKLDAIYFSPHKFLGGPGSSGILIFCNSLYNNRIPDCPGGGTVDWTNPWGQHKYIDQIEEREDGGTPAFLQTIKVAQSILLKEKMGVDNITNREKELNDIMWPGLTSIPGLHMLANNHRERLCIYSFFIEDLHYNLAVKMLNDRYGIQVRGGCSCAGTYGHYLLEVSYELSQTVTNEINMGILNNKPGWIRMSVHPTTTDEEAKYLVNAVREIAENHVEWAKDYEYDMKHNQFILSNQPNMELELVKTWFTNEVESV